MVFIKKTPTIQSMSGSIIPLLASSNFIPDLKIPGDGKVHIYEIPLEVSTNGETDFHMNFKLSPELIDQGLMLVGAYHNGNAVRMAVISFSQDVTLKEKGLMGEVILTETVRYFQTDISNSVPVIGFDELKPKKNRTIK